MVPDELPPSHGLLALGSRWDAMAFEDVADRLITDCIAQVAKSTHDAVIAPRAILSGHPHHKVFQLLGNAGTSDCMRLRGTDRLWVPALVVPRQDGIRLGNRRDLFQCLPAQLLPYGGQCFAITVRQWHAPANLLAEDTVLRCKVGITEPEFFVYRCRDRPEQLLPVHPSITLAIMSSIADQYGL